MALQWTPELEAAAADLVRAYNRLWNAVRHSGSEQAKSVTLALMKLAGDLLDALKAAAKQRRADEGL